MMPTLGISGETSGLVSGRNPSPQFTFYFENIYCVFQYSLSFVNITIKMNILLLYN